MAPLSKRKASQSSSSSSSSSPVGAASLPIPSIALGLLAGISVAIAVKWKNLQKKKNSKMKKTQGESVAPRPSSASLELHQQCTAADAEAAGSALDMTSRDQAREDEDGDDDCRIWERPYPLLSNGAATETCCSTQDLLLHSFALSKDPSSLHHDEEAAMVMPCVISSECFHDNSLPPQNHRLHDLHSAEKSAQQQLESVTLQISKEQSPYLCSPRHGCNRGLSVEQSQNQQLVLLTEEGEKESACRTASDSEVENVSAVHSVEANCFPAMEDDSEDGLPVTEEDATGDGFSVIEKVAIGDCFPSSEDDAAGDGFPATEEVAAVDDFPAMDKDVAGDGSLVTEEDAAGNGFSAMDEDVAGDGFPTTEEDGAGDGFPTTEEDGAGDGSPTTEEDGAGDGFQTTDEDGAGEEVAAGDAFSVMEDSASKATEDESGDGFQVMQEDGGHPSMPVEDNTGDGFTAMEGQTGNCFRALEEDRGDGSRAVGNDLGDAFAAKEEESGGGSPAMEGEASGDGLAATEEEAAGDGYPATEKEARANGSPASEEEVTATGDGSPASEEEAAGDGFLATNRIKDDEVLSSSPPAKKEESGDGFLATEEEATGDGYPATEEEAAGDGYPATEEEATGDGFPATEEEEEAGDGFLATEDEAAGDGVNVDVVASSPPEFRLRAVESEAGLASSSSSSDDRCRSGSLGSDDDDESAEVPWEGHPHAPPADLYHGNSILLTTTDSSVGHGHSQVPLITRMEEPYDTRLPTDGATPCLPSAAVEGSHEVWLVSNKEKEEDMREDSHEACLVSTSDKEEEVMIVVECNVRCQDPPPSQSAIMELPHHSSFFRTQPEPLLLPMALDGCTVDNSARTDAASSENAHSLAFLLISDASNSHADPAAGSTCSVHPDTDPQLKPPFTVQASLEGGPSDATNHVIEHHVSLEDVHLAVVKDGVNAVVNDEQHRQLVVEDYGSIGSNRPDTEGKLNPQLAEQGSSHEDVHLAAAHHEHQGSLENVYFTAENDALVDVNDEHRRQSLLEDHGSTGSIHSNNLNPLLREQGSQEDAHLAAVNNEHLGSLEDVHLVVVNDALANVNDERQSKSVMEDHGSARSSSHVNHDHRSTADVSCNDLLGWQNFQSVVDHSLCLTLAQPHLVETRKLDECCVNGYGYSPALEASLPERSIDDSVPVGLPRLPSADDLFDYVHSSVDSGAICHSTVTVLLDDNVLQNDFQPAADVYGNTSLKADADYNHQLKAEVCEKYISTLNPKPEDSRSLVESSDDTCLNFVGEKSFHLATKVCESIHPHGEEFKTNKSLMESSDDTYSNVVEQPLSLSTAFHSSGMFLVADKCVDLHFPMGQWDTCADGNLNGAYENRVENEYDRTLSRLSEDHELPSFEDDSTTTSLARSGEPDVQSTMQHASDSHSGHAQGLDQQIMNSYGEDDVHKSKMEDRICSETLGFLPTISVDDETEKCVVGGISHCQSAMEQTYDEFDYQSITGRPGVLHLNVHGNSDLLQPNDIDGRDPFYHSTKEKSVNDTSSVLVVEEEFNLESAMLDRYLNPDPSMQGGNFQQSNLLMPKDAHMGIPKKSSAMAKSYKACLLGDGYFSSTRDLVVTSSSSEDRDVQLIRKEPDEKLMKRTGIDDHLIYRKSVASQCDMPANGEHNCPSSVDGVSSKIVAEASSHSYTDCSISGDVAKILHTTTDGIAIDENTSDSNNMVEHITIDPHVAVLSDEHMPPGQCLGEDLVSKGKKHPFGVVIMEGMLSHVKPVVTEITGAATTNEPLRKGEDAEAGDNLETNLDEETQRIEQSPREVGGIMQANTTLRPVNKRKKRRRAKREELASDDTNDQRGTLNSPGKEGLRSRIERVIPYVVLGMGAICLLVSVISIVLQYLQASEPLVNREEF